VAPPVCVARRAAAPHDAPRATTVGAGPVQSRIGVPLVAVAATAQSAHQPESWAAASSAREWCASKHERERRGTLDPMPCPVGGTPGTAPLAEVNDGLTADAARYGVPLWGASPRCRKRALAAMPAIVFIAGPATPLTVAWGWLPTVGARRNPSMPTAHQGLATILPRLEVRVKGHGLAL
jgi:hypothetical protein